VPPPAFPLTRNGDRVFGSISNRQIQHVPDKHDADAIRDRYRTFFDSAFMPNIRHEQMAGADERVAYAAEFAAHQLGQIDDKLGRLIEIMERRRTAQSS
jgi:hypothetical protein